MSRRCDCARSGTATVIDPVTGAVYPTGEGGHPLIPDYGPTVINGVDGSGPVGATSTTNGITTTLVGPNAFTITAT